MSFRRHMARGEGASLFSRRNASLAAPPRKADVSASRQDASSIRPDAQHPTRIGTSVAPSPGVGEASSSSLGAHSPPQHPRLANVLAGGYINGPTARGRWEAPGEWGRGGERMTLAPVLGERGGEPCAGGRRSASCGVSKGAAEAARRMGNVRGGEPDEPLTRRRDDSDGARALPAGGHQA